jgi:hypothetical protein
MFQREGEGERQLCSELIGNPINWTATRQQYPQDGESNVFSIPCFLPASGTKEQLNTLKPEIHLNNM